VGTSDQLRRFRHRVKYVNQWREPRVFTFHSSMPHLLRVEEDRLELDGRSSANVVLLVNKLPQGTAGLDASFLDKYSDVQVYLSVSDERGHAEETLLVHLRYTR
jgi:hypothetical protein